MRRRRAWTGSRAAPAFCRWSTPSSASSTSRRSTPRTSTACSQERRDALRAGQDLLYKGISADTSARIFDTLYRRSIDGAEPDVGYAARCELRELGRTAGGALRLVLHHLDAGRDVHARDRRARARHGLPRRAGAGARAGRARGARRARPAGRRGRLPRAPARRRRRRDRLLFVQNAELHSHGVGAPDLGLGAHRNAVIVNALCGREVYPVRERNVFQSFGPPAGARRGRRRGSGVRAA